MGVIEHSVVIERPLFDVFDYLMDVERLWEWAPFVLDSEVVERDPVGWPTRYRARAGVTWEVSYETEIAITDVRRGHSISFRMAEPPQVAIYTLQPTLAGTLVTASHNPWATLLLAPLQGSFDSMTRDFLNDALANMKRTLEARPPASRPVVFLSYRRKAAEYVVGRIAETIAREFGSASLFRDLDAISAGENSDKAIDAALAGCAAVIVLIDRTWIEEFERRRGAKDKDYVLMEIAAGLRSDKRVIPVALQDVDVEAVRARVPPEIEDLKGMQWQKLRQDPDFASDMNRIVEAIWREVMKGGPSHADDAPLRAPNRPGPPAWDAMLSGAIGSWADFAQRMMMRGRF